MALSCLLIISSAYKSFYEGLIITCQTTETKVEFELTNTGTVLESGTYIVIQDDLLMVHSEQLTISPGDTEIVSVEVESTANHTYKLVKSE